MSELELIIDLHKHNSQQGPGSKKDTLQALNFTNLPFRKKLLIADIGCGTGRQSLTLADHLDAKIISIDVFPEFLEELEARASSKGLHKKIETLQASMESLPFSERQFDCVWSEGAIYNMGFQKGIAYWKQFLKPFGYICLSEITWTSNSRPKEIEEFWQNEYPEISQPSDKIQQLEKAGYSLKGYFTLSKNSWNDNYHLPLEKQIPLFLERNGNSELAQKVAQEHLTEIKLYNTYKDFYSYGFYVAQLEN